MFTNYDLFTQANLQPELFEDVLDYVRFKSLLTRGTWQCRGEFTEEFAWAIPTMEALKEIATSGTVIEVGAGSGFWGYLAKRYQQLNGIENTIHLYDQERPEGDRFDSQWIRDHGWYNFKRQYVDVNRSNVDYVSYWVKKADTLFLCWPPMSSFAFDSVKQFEGDKIIYIGESWEGCTANYSFFNLMSIAWKEEKTIQLPQWSGIHDEMVIYRRKLNNDDIDWDALPNDIQYEPHEEDDD
jgi:hypothetical protein